MNSYERLMNRLAGKPVDRLPNLCLVMQFAAHQLNIPYGKFVTDYRLLADGMWHIYETYGVDALCVISDPMREASAFGTAVLIPEDNVPYQKEHLLKTVADFAKIKVSDPSANPRMLDRLEAVRLLHEKALGEVAVIGWVEGAFAESCDLMDMSQLMMTVYDYPAEVHQLLDVCTSQAEKFALAQIAAGAEIIGIGDAAASLIGPKLFKKFALPYQQRLISTIHQAGAMAKLHICGNINPIMSLIAETGADIVDCDHMVDMENALQILPTTTCIGGNFDPVNVLLNGTIEDIQKAVHQTIQLPSKTTMVASGCEVPKFTPKENLLAVSNALLG
ncbi:MAG: uroporphyrinogen decarboxylase family protein [Clostridia bacterium]